MILTDDDLIDGGVLTDADLVDAKPAKRAKPATPKKPTLGEMQERARTFRPLQDPAPGYDLRLEQEPGGVVLQFPKGDSFKAEGVTVGTKEPGKLKPRIAGVRREDGESLESFLKRSEAWHKGEKARKAQERKELAQVRARTTPSKGPIGRAVEGFKQGFGEVIRTTGVGASLVTGQEPDFVGFEQPLPMMNEQDSESWLAKSGQGLGSMAGFMLASAAVGPTAVTLLGAAQNAGQTYEEARARGVGHDEALAAAVPGALIGALEGIGGGGGAARGFLKGTLGEAGQEGLTQVLNNINAKFISGYDPQRVITEGVFESMVLGGLLGAGVHGVGAALAGREAPIPKASDRVDARLAGQLAAQEPVTWSGPGRVAPAGARSGINPSFIADPDERRANLLAWHKGADPRLKDAEGMPIAVYHGTQSPVEIQQLDMSKLDPNALYGPGFYTTQDAEVAAGDGGYAENKLPSGIPRGWATAGDEDEQVGNPHAYKLHLNIRRPFDIDAPIDPSDLAAINSQAQIRNRVMGKTGAEVYDELIDEVGSKEEANKVLQQAGYDGITHIGGGRWGRGSDRPRFTNRTEAEAKAREIGGSVKEIVPVVNSFQGVGRTTYHVVDPNNRSLSLLMEDGWPKGFATEEEAQAAAQEFGPQYEIEGHRVWIAFDPSQVKSATGNQGTFAKGDPRLSASFVADPDERQANLLTWHEGAHPGLKKKDGLPIVVYHGTQSPVEIVQFNPDKVSSDSWFGPGLYTSEDPSIASLYAIESNPMYGQNAIAPDLLHRLQRDGIPVTETTTGRQAKLILSEAHFGEGKLSRSEYDNYIKAIEELKNSAVYPFYLNIKNPFDGDANAALYEQMVEEANGDKKAVRDKLIGMGYDGIVHTDYGQVGIKGEGVEHKVWIAFHPNQVKSAIGNEGTYAKDDPRLSVSFTSDQMLEMEQRAARAGRPVALRPVTVNSFQQQIGAINQELMRLDPTSEEFARLADRAVQLRRAVEEAPTPEDLRDGRTMREWARKHSMWHDGAAEDLLELLGITDESGQDVSLPGIKADWGLYHRNVKSGARGARFYPLPADNGRGGTVFLSPQSLVDVGAIQPEEMGKIGGLNVPLSTAEDYARMAELGGHADVAGAIRGAIAEAKQKGLPKVALAMYVPGQGLTTTRRFLRHESFHTGQQVAADDVAILDTGIWNNPMTLVSQELLYHPIVAKVASLPGGQSVLAYYDGDQSALAFEMAAYAAAGQTAELGWTREEADAYLADYLLDVLETSGVEALEGLARGARLSGPVSRQIEDLKGKHYEREQRRRDRANSFAASLRAPSTTPGGPSEVGRGGQEGGAVGQGGDGQGTVEEPVDGVFVEEEREYDELTDEGMEWDEADLEEQAIEEAFEEAVALPPTPPNDPSGGITDGSRPTLKEEVVAKAQYESLRQQLLNMAVQGGFKYDPLVPPGIQLAKAIEGGHLDLSSIEDAMKAEGMTVDDLANLAEFTQHRAGQILNELSKLSKAVQNLIQTNPAAAAAIVGPNKVMQEGLKILERTELGHSMWERAGNVMRKNFLSRLATAFTQVWSTTAQIPLDIASGAVAGFAMRRLNPEKWQGNATGMLARAKEDAVRGVLPIITLAKGMNPKQVGDLLRLRAPSEQARYRQMADDLSASFPEFYGKLHGREDLAQSSPGVMSPAMLKQVLPMIKDKAKRREYEVRLRTLEGRERLNKSIAGKVFKGYEKALDLVLWPLSVQEYAFRRPIFIGALQRELEAQGHDLNDFIVNPHKVAGAHDIIQRAVDEALRFTWAYEPKTANKEVGQMEQAMEGAANYFVKFWNKLGPIGATLEAFPRALTNGLKFAYEWSPFGFVSPAWQVQDKMRHGARDQITFQEAQRMAQAVVGTAMYAVALGLREWAGGEEWWQIKTGKKTKDGKPVYYDARRIPQLAFFLNAADIAKRASEGTLGDIKVEQRLKDTYLGARRNSQPGDLGAIDQFMLMWTGNEIPTNAKQRAQLAVGQWGSTFVIPLTNVRDAWAQFSAEEGTKKDLRDRPLLGPSIDKLPWLRRQLPNAEGPFEVAPQGTAYAPLAEGESLGPLTGAYALGGAIGATRITPGQSFAAREFSRLGLSPYTWLKRDPDPKIDRAQWHRMSVILQAIGASLSNNPSYLSQSPAQQRAIWEEIIGGPDGAASEAKAAGLEANPREADRRKELQSVPPYRRKAIKLDKLIPPVGQQ